MPLKEIKYEKNLKSKHNDIYAIVGGPCHHKFDHMNNEFTML